MTAAADSTGLRGDLLNAIFKQVSYTGPDLWLTLYETDSSTEIAVPVRAQIGTVDWDVVEASPNAHAENNDEVTIEDVPSATATGAMLMDASTGGNIVCSEDFAAPIVLPEGATVVFSAGDLTFSLDHI